MIETPSDPAQDPGSERSSPLMLSNTFTRWLAEANCSLALTTYQAGRLMMIGRKPDGSVRANERLIEQCQGLWTDGQTLWTSSLYALWRFENDLDPGVARADGVDRIFMPRESRITAQVDMHDIGLADLTPFGRTGTAPVFVSTAFNCLATIDDHASFRPLWKPPFISDYVGEDRCHMNGMALDGTRVAYVTAVSRSDVADGWRERRQDGGVIIDVESQEIVASGLSMPHSPRLYDGRLWVLDSGRGQLCTVDPQDGKVTPVAFCPGYARGLAFIGRFAVVGLSKPRRNGAFSGLALDGELKARDAAARCGLIVIDIDTGQTIEWLRFEHTIEELYDVAVMPGVVQPESVGFRGDAIMRTVRMATD